MGNVKTTEDFIVKAKLVHGDRYDYSKSVYVNAITKLIIICSEHGEFLQDSSNHFAGKNCSKCSKSGTKLTTESFIVRSKEVHDDKYDYSKSVYVNAKTKLIIICPEHGEFKQNGGDHISGRNCILCSRINTHNKLRLNLNDFTYKAKLIHKDRYDYSKVNYKNYKTNVIIICFEHGEFKQTPANHFKGQNCPRCSGKGVTYMSFKDARDYIRKLNLKSSKEYWNWWEDNKEFCLSVGLPKIPHSAYRNGRNFTS